MLYILKRQKKSLLLICAGYHARDSVILGKGGTVRREKDLIFKMLNVKGANPGARVRGS